MPHQEKSYRPHDAVLWPAEGVDEYGRVMSGDAVALKVRWTGGRRQSVTALGQPIATDATVVLDREVFEDDKMWLGHISDLPPGTSFVDEDEDVMVVVLTKEVSDLKGRVTYYEAGLQYFRESIPEEG